MLIFTAREMGHSGSSSEYIVALDWQDTATGREGGSTVEAIIEWLDKGNSAYVVRGGATIDVLVERPLGRRPYLRTRPDHTGRDNLLALPLRSSRRAS